MRWGLHVSGRPSYGAALGHRVMRRLLIVLFVTGGIAALVAVPRSSLAQSTTASSTSPAVSVTYSGTVTDSFVVDLGGGYTDRGSMSLQFSESGDFAGDPMTASGPVQLQASGSISESDDYPGASADQNCSGTLYAPQTSIPLSGIVGALVSSPSTGGTGMVSIEAVLPVSQQDGVSSTGSGDCSSSSSYVYSYDQPTSAYEAALCPACDSPVTFPVTQSSFTASYPVNQSGLDPTDSSVTHSLVVSDQLSATYSACPAIGDGSGTTIAAGQACCLPSGAAADRPVSERARSRSVSPASSRGRDLAEPAAADPSATVASSGPRVFAYETIYSGTFTYKSTLSSCDSGSASFTNNYDWTIIRIDKFTDEGHRRFTERLTVSETASGGSTKTGSGKFTWLEPGPRHAPPLPSAKTECTVVSQPEQVFSRIRQGRLVPVPAKLAETPYVYWNVPATTDPSGNRYFDGWPGRNAGDGGEAPGVDEHCVDSWSDGTTRRYTPPDGTSLVGNYDKTTALQWKNGEFPKCGFVGSGYLQVEPGSFGFDALWSGNTLAHPFVARTNVGYVDGAPTYNWFFKSKDSISGLLGGGVGGGTSAVPIQCSYSYSYDTRLHFQALICPVHAIESDVPVAEQEVAEKKVRGCLRGVPDAVIREILNGLDPSFGFGDGDSVLFPGMPEDGDVDFGIDGSGALGAADAARAGPLAAHTSSQVIMYTGSAELKTATPQAINLHLTKAGAQVLAHDQGKPFTARYVVSFTPTGGKPVTLARSFTLTPSSVH